VILEKKAGAIHVDLLRAILLMEADFNAAMKILIGTVWFATRLRAVQFLKSVLGVYQNIRQFKCH